MTFLLKSLTLVSALGFITPSYADICQVPLKIVNIGSISAPSYKIGINVGLGGGAPRLYELDTGGSGFWAAYDGNLKPKKQWWGDNTLISQGTMSILYTSGNNYTANIVETEVAMFDPSSKKAVSPLCRTPNAVKISQITAFSNSKSKSNVVQQWNQRLPRGKGPLYKNFWGDFGAALHPTMSTTGAQGVYTILNQFQTGAEHNGFIIHVGDLTKPKKQKPYVQIGLNGTDISSFPFQFPMNSQCPTISQLLPECSPWSTYSNTAVNTFAEAQFNADVTLNGKDGSPPPELLPSLGIIIDSGATLANIFQNPNCVTNCFVPNSFIANPQPEPGITPTIYKGQFIKGYSANISGTTLNNEPFSTSLSQSTHPLNSSVAANYSASKAAGGTGGVMNTGVLFYSSWDVMYDVTSGIIGFRPASQ